MSNLLGNGANFRSYLLQWEFWQNQPMKSRKTFKNTLRVMYGKKKDRGYIKAKFKKIMEEEEALKQKIEAAILRRVFQNWEWDFIRYADLSRKK